jgi:hypothetical protein
VSQAKQNPAKEPTAKRRTKKPHFFAIRRMFGLLVVRCVGSFHHPTLRGAHTQEKLFLVMLSGGKNITPKNENAMRKRRIPPF